MSGENRILTSEAGRFISDGVNAIAKALGGKTKLSFKDIQRYVRAGVIDRYLSIGDEIEVEKETGISTVVHTTGSLSASVNEAIWDSHVEHLHHGVYEFTYDGYEWSEHELGEGLDLAYYGISTSGTAVDGDVIAVTVSTTVLVFQYVAKDKVELRDPSLIHSATFQLKNCYSNFQFDAPEAVIYASEAMPAGTYHFNLYKPGNIYYLNAGLQNKNVQFTTTVAIPAGGQITLASSNFNDITSVSGIKLNTYVSRGASTALESNIVCSEGTSGTDLGNANTVANNGKINSTDRVNFGSNNWKNSALRLWLNSNSGANAWWSAQGLFDLPSAYVSTPGWMYGIERDFLDVIQETKNTTTTNWFDGGQAEVTYDKFFIPGYGQVWFDTSTDGTPWDYYVYFSDNTSASYGADSNRIKLLNGSPRYWWTRTPYGSYSSYEYGVRPTGADDLNDAHNSYGVAPACTIA